MDYLIECPVCEQHFKCSADSPSAKVKCPGCSRKFPLSSAVKLGTSIPMAKKTKPSPSKIRLAVPATKVSDQDSDSSKIDFDSKRAKPKKAPESVTAPIASVGKKPITARRLIKKKRKQRRVIWTIGLLAAIIGLLSVLLIIQLQKNPIGNSSARNEEQPAAENDGSVDGTSDNSKTADSNEPADDTAAASTDNADSKKPRVKDSPPVKRIRLDDLEPIKNVFHSDKDVVNCWDLVHKHLVNLTVHDAKGEHPAVATIVDSRGWIVTSYNAVKGASKIDVTASVKSIDELPKPDLLKDVVRGVIKLDPKQDLAVLSINRRFVESFADIKVTPKYRVLEGEYLIQSTPPSKIAPYARRETKMEICDKLGALSGKAQAMAKERELESPELNWIVCPDKQSTLPGAPLIRIDGTFEAINVFTENDLAYYVPVDRLRDLIADADDKPQPMALLGGANMEDGVVAVETTHPMRKTSVMINRLAEKCQKFNWIPKNREDYDQLLDFSKQYVTAINFIKKNKEDEPELAAEIKTQTDRIGNSILKSLAENVDYPATKQANEFSAEELKKPNHVVPIFAKVFELSISAGSDILVLDQTENFVALTDDDSRKQFQREGECLGFVRTQKRPSTITYSIRGQKIPASVVRLMTRFDISN